MDTEQKRASLRLNLIDLLRREVRRSPILFGTSVVGVGFPAFPAAQDPKVAGSSKLAHHSFGEPGSNLGVPWVIGDIEDLEGIVS